jgi:hypothetical protein
MTRRFLFLPALLLASLSARAGEAQFDAYGTVAFIQSASGPYTAVQLGDVVHLRFKASTPGMVITPGQLEQFTVDPASVVFEVGMLSTATGTGTPSVVMQNNNFGGPDGVRLFSAPIAGSSTVTYDFSAGSPNLFNSTDPLQNLGMWSPAFASYDCRIAGGGTAIDWTPTTIAISAVQVGTPFCFGDGSAAACPCGNLSPVGDRSGCLNSLGTGGKISATGTPSLGADTLILDGSQMPNSSALYFQGTTTLNGGLGAVFGDGLRCAGGSILRLVTKSNVGGVSRFPSTGEPSVSVRGGVAAPGTFVYQVWYRNAAAFCSSSTFNLTNGLSIAWEL